MADIRLAKPAAGASESVQCAPEARFVFDFPTTDATLARDGDNLNIRFEDGSNLELQGFYQQYNEENLPSFNIDGTEVAAADFFAAMNEPDLMPAAGPGTGTVANGARFHEWGDSSLTGGIQHLDGLDWGFSRSFEWDDVPNAVGRNGDDWGWLGASGTPVAPTPENPGDVPPGSVPPDGPVPPTPGTPGHDDPKLNLNASDLYVREQDLGDGTTSSSGVLKITAKDGVDTVKIGDAIVVEGGKLVDDAAARTLDATHDGVEGKLVITGFNAATGELRYTFTLNDATQQHEHGGDTDVHLGFTYDVTVTDSNGTSKDTT
ncbi:MAG: hypothetical protein HDQ89_05645, partial [Desulfovibrio sp.]|nr:hypothetical protein [Desulfovibrio sp.]